ncbi:lipocalin family protein [Pseudotenacibaculum haliotis]|uniref:Lipocalin family protein n=1 Tax=Pseudotenacibaculum haliotis TaxID=1862138 RepID=A0ABW5LMS0_9FLAO
MKKIFLSLVLCLSLFSCSSNDDDNPDLIVGTWNLFSLNGTTASDCEKRSFVTFLANNTAAGENYNTDVNNNCVRIGVDETVQWVNSGNNTYTIGSNSNPLIWNVVFSDNNNTFTITNQGVVYKRQ